MGSVLDRSFAIWGRNLVPFTILGAIVYFPLVIHTLVVLRGAEQQGRILVATVLLGYGPDAVSYTVSRMGLSYVLGLVATGAMAFGTFRQLRGEPAGLLLCLRAGVTRFLPVVGVGLFVGLLAIICAIVSFLVLGVLGLWVGQGWMGVSATAVLPAVVWCSYWVAVPVAVVERPGLVASLARSAQLTRGDRFRVLALVLVLQLLQVAAAFLVMLVVGPRAVSIGVWATLSVTVLLGALGAVVSSVAYHDLRVAREGVGVEELIRVFA